MRPPRGPVEVRIERSGHNYRLVPLSSKARDWFNANYALTGGRRDGDGVGIEAFYIGLILKAIRASGLRAQ